MGGIHYDEDVEPNPQAQIFRDYEETEERGRLGNIPHLCVKDNPQFKYKNLCFAFDKDMAEINLQFSDISGYADLDGRCHYPLTIGELTHFKLTLLTLCQVTVVSFSIPVSVQLQIHEYI